MTVSSITPVNNYTGNGSNVQFDFDFLIESEDELQVTVINSVTKETVLLTCGVDYSIHEIGNKNGSYITYPLNTSSHNVLSSDEVISLSLNLVVQQESEFANSSNLKLSVLEWTFDYIVRILQIFNRKLARSVKVQEGTDINTDELVQEVNVIYENIDNINAVNSNASNINAAVANETNINAVSGSIFNVNAVGNSINNVNAVSDDLTNINSVESDLSNIDIVATDISDVVMVASNISSVNTVADDLELDSNSEIKKVNANKNNIDTVAANISNVNAIGPIASAVSNVSGISASVVSVAGDLTNINSVASDLSNIDEASSNAALSKQYAIGYPTEPTEGSAKYWAAQAAQGQVQSDWEEIDITKKSFIKNKPNLSLKQDALVSGTNIKTINNQTLLGSGNIDTTVSFLDITGNPTDNANLSTALNNKQNTLKLGSAINIENNTVSTSLYDGSKFTIYGSPTITDDGISSGFSDSNYIDCNARQYSFTDNVTFKIKFKVNEITSILENYLMFAGPGEGYQAIQIYQYGDMVRIQDLYYVSSEMQVAMIDFNDIQVNEEFNLKLVLTPTTFSVYRTFDNNTWNLVETKQLAQSANMVNFQGYLGKHEGSGHYFTGEIDLKNFSIVIDGDEKTNANQTVYKALKKSNVYSFPSNRYKDLTLGASGSTYTAPANGYYAFAKAAGGSSQYCNLENTTCNFGKEIRVPSNGHWVTNYIPCKKNDVITCRYTLNGSLGYFKFIYAEGEE